MRYFVTNIAIVKFSSILWEVGNNVNKSNVAIRHSCNNTFVEFIPEHNVNKFLQNVTVKAIRPDSNVGFDSADHRTEQLYQSIL
jgi:hypothetical protein